MNPEAIISVPLPKDKGTIEFKNSIEVSEWWKQQKEFKTKVLNSPDLRNNPIDFSRNSISEYVQHIERLFRAVDLSLPKFVNGNNPADIDNGRKELESSLRQLCSQGSFIVASSSEAQKVLSLCEKQGDSRGFFALAYFSGFKILTGSAGSVEGIIEAALFERGLSSGAKEEKSVLNKLQAEYSEKFLKTHREGEDWKVKFENIVKEGESTRSNEAQNFTSQLNKQSEQHKALTEKFEVEFKTFIDVYDQKLALQAPVHYWKEKGKKHTQYVKNNSLALVLSGVAIMALIVFETKYILGWNNKLSEIPLWRFSILIATIGIGVWILRILVRVLLSNIHLASDAHERRAMILTYLALIRRKAVTIEKDQAFILQTLFRPTSTGIIKDDGLPEYLSAWAKKLSDD